MMRIRGQKDTFYVKTANEIFNKICREISNRGSVVVDERDLIVTNPFNVSVYDLLRQNFPNLVFEPSGQTATVTISMPIVGVIYGFDGSVVAYQDPQFPGVRWEPPVPEALPEPAVEQRTSRVLDLEPSEPKAPRPSTRILDLE